MPYAHLLAACMTTYRPSIWPCRHRPCLPPGCVQVVELAIVRDKGTLLSKGSAFLWYSTRAHAETAILQLNLLYILPDPTGEQDRPLAVRKASCRSKAAREQKYQESQVNTALYFTITYFTVLHCATLYFTVLHHTGNVYKVG